MTKLESTGLRIGIIVLILVLAAAYFLLPSLNVGDKTKAENNVRDLYRLITGSDVEVVKTAEQSGLYKITIRFRDATGRDALQDVFVTKDGLMLTDRLVDLEVQKSSLTNQSAFAQCLFDKQVRILGLSTDPATQAQLQVLGAFSVRIYADCGGQNLALCQQLNITLVPVIFVNGTLVQGPLNRDWFEQNTGCYMTATGAKQ